MIQITGTILPGQGRGQETGAATANLELRLAHGLPKGLYACLAELAGVPYKGLLYHGYNSLTQTDCLEVHLFGYTGNLHGQKITVQIGQFLRGEKKFNSVAELKKQITEDLKNFS